MLDTYIHLHFYYCFDRFTAALVIRPTLSAPRFTPVDTGFELVVDLGFLVVTRFPTEMGC